MTRLELRFASQLPAAKIWPYIADFGNIHRISPLVRRTTMLSTQSCGIGSERVCHMDLGMGLQERVVEWKEGESYTIDILKMSAPIKNGKVTLGVRPAGTGSELFMDVAYDHLFGGLGSVMNVLMTKPMMTLVLGWFLRTIDRRVSAGLEPVKSLAASTR